MKSGENIWMIQKLSVYLQSKIIIRIQMKRTIAFIVLLTVIGTGSPLSAQDADQEQDLQELYRQIDDAIDHSPEYVAKRLRQIADTQ